MRLDQIRKQATEILNLVAARVVEGGVTQKTVAEVWAFLGDILADVTAVMNGGKRREDILADVKALSLIGYQGRFLQGTRKEEPSTGELLLKNVLEVVYADEINRILKKKPVSRGTLQDWVNKWYSKDAWYQTRMEASRLQEAEKVRQSKNSQGVTPKDPWLTDTGTMAFPLRNALTFGSRELLKHRWAKMPKDRLKPMYHPDGDSPSYRVRMGGDYQVSNHRYQDLGKQTPTQSRQASDKVWLEGLYSALVNDVKETYDRLLGQIEAATTPDDLKSLGYNIAYFRQDAEDSPIEEDINRMTVELEAELEKKKVALGALPKEETRREEVRVEGGDPLPVQLMSEAEALELPELNNLTGNIRDTPKHPGDFAFDTAMDVLTKFKAGTERLYLNLSNSLLNRTFILADEHKELTEQIASFATRSEDAAQMASYLSNRLNQIPKRFVGGV